ncbi:phosphoglycerate dehydrogenase [Psychrobacillus lasiicapitis]|uniref:D-3-phosphoglycerate dehydrogenase n=1 Tax=Psychrobacillus lasiicapitis TaxID=1636719 RepID=A0A544SYC9_9BACI|nr:phosphoglycerate dehydrogenase [Psychrobacillus lasiicapitis]TQR10213.1 phosphoglycerate dehydrogenase [Psychrobacillus lasiicapitis]GGA46343.1 D-3-phosphoglycerate dehydrogenase [Psychrobacillus lasiicapitis]
MAFNILISDPLSEDGIYPLRQAEGFNIVIETNLSPEELGERIGEFDALLVRSQTQVTREIIEKGTRLKIIGRAGVGVDNIDLPAATERGIIVVNAPDGNTNSAAEHTVAMLMSLARNIPQAFHALKNQKWDRKAFIGVELKNKTLGVVGLGRIGAEVATRAKGQRMNVIAYDPFLTPEKAEKLGVQFGTIDEVIRAADFITVHTPLLKETRHLINKEAFEKMKDGVQIINCARGGIIDEDALYNAIVEGKVAGAALDVFEEEPFLDHKLLTLPQVIATPHLGASTVEAQEIVAVDVSYDVVSFLQGGVVKNPVNLPSVPKDIMAKIEPYFNLVEKLGSFLSDLADGVAEELNIYYSGELANMTVGPLTRNAVKGLLKSKLGESVNDVNAKFLADRIGIVVNEHKTTKSKGFMSLITVEVKTDKETRKVSGTLLNGLGARIVRVDDFVVDVVPEGYLLFIRHKDQPGAIGRVGTLLAAEGINIAGMQVGRSEVGGDAIMMLSIDKHVEETGVEQLKGLADIYDATPIDL